MRHAVASGGAARSHRATGAPGGTTLVVRLARSSPTHHRFEIVRSDGTCEAHELETRSWLLHDLVHFALETEAALSNSFYGLLARGVAYAKLAEGMAGAGYELAMTEQVVGALQGAVQTVVDPAQFVAAFTGWQRSLGATCPTWLTKGPRGSRARAAALPARAMARHAVRRGDGAAVPPRRMRDQRDRVSRPGSRRVVGLGRSRTWQWRSSRGATPPPDPGSREPVSQVGLAAAVGQDPAAFHIVKRHVTPLG